MTPTANSGRTSSAPGKRASDRAILNIAVATVRTRWTGFAGAFVALALGSTLITMMALALAATIGTPHRGPQRFADVTAETVVVQADPRGDAMAATRSVLPAEAVAGLSSVGATTADRTFPVASQNGPSDLVGHGWSSAALTPYQLTAGRPPTAAGETVATAGTGFRLGGIVHLGTPRGLADYTVVGIVGQKWFEHAVFLTDGEAARVSPPINVLAVAANPSAVRTAVGGSPLVLSGDARQQADPDPSGGSNALMNPQAMAATSGIVAVTVAIFIVIATFAFVVEQRVRELALLRLVGATPRQVRRMVLSEAAVIGAAAAATGAVLGTAGAKLLNTWMRSNGVAPDWFHIGVNPIAILVAAVLSVGSALAGAAAVAWRASRTKPVDALREAAASTKAMTPVRWLLGICMLAGAVVVGYVVASTAPGSAVNARKYASVPLLYVGGVALLAPVLLQPVARLFTWPLTKIGAGPMIVRQNTLNARRRTAAMVTPVAIAVGLTTAMLCMQAAGDQARTDVGRQATHADAVVLPAYGTTLSQSSVTALESVTGVSTTTVTDARIYIGDASGDVLDALTGQAVAPQAMGAVLTPRVLQGSLANLDPDFIVVDDHTAQSDDVSLGQALTVWLPDGSRTTLKVAAVVQTGLQGDDTYMSAAALHVGQPALAWLRLASGTPVSAVTTALAGQPVEVQTAGDYFDVLGTKQKAQTRTAATVILGLSVGYSLISVANTLIMAAAGRRREFAALHLGGARQSQILRVVAAESLLAVVIGTLLAAVAGLAVTVTQHLSLTKIADSTPTIVPWADLWQVVVLCAAVALCASLVAARQSMRGRAIEAVSARE